MQIILNNFRLTAFVIISFLIGSACQVRTENQSEKLDRLPITDSNKYVKSYDSAKYNLTSFPDTTGCGLWILSSDKYNDSLINEMVVAKNNGRHKVLAVKGVSHYLWPCNLPEFIQAEDTIIVSANIYDIQKNESMPGKPTIIKAIHYRH